MKKLVLQFVELVFSVFTRANDVISGKVVTVIDGGTLELIAEDHVTYKIMLHGIDCSEMRQEYGDKARRYLEKLLLDKAVSVELMGKDRWGTRLGVIILEGETDREMNY